jgi:hypothetical protein
MTRVLVTYASLADRRLATRRAVLLTQRGIDADLASAATAEAIAGAGYERVWDAASSDLLLALRAPIAPREGMLGIAGPAPAPTPTRAAVPLARRLTWRAAAFVLVAMLISIALIPLGLPGPYPVLIGLLTAGFALHLFGGKRHEPASVVPSAHVRDAA